MFSRSLTKDVVAGLCNDENKYDCLKSHYYAPINVNPVGGGGGVRARGGDLMPETIPLSGF